MTGISSPRSGTRRVRKVLTTRRGGFSASPYDSFNLGDHVGDDPAAVAANRRRLAEGMGLDPSRFVWMEQIHSNTVTVVDGPVDGPVPATDATVTTVPGLALTVLVVVCAMLSPSRINEARSHAAPAAPTDLILPPDIQTTAKPDTKKYDDLPDVDISSWEYLIASQAHNISDYVPDVSKISGSQSTFDSRAVDALNALLKAARDAGWSPYIYCAYRPYLTQNQQYEDQVSENMRKGDTRDEAETAAARIAAPPGTSDHQTGLGADIVDQLRVHTRILGPTTAGTSRSLQDILDEHRPVLDAIRRGSGVEARDRMRSHIEITGHLLLTQAMPDADAAEVRRVWQQRTEGY